MRAIIQSNGICLSIRAKSLLKISPAGDIDYYKFKTDTIGTINVSLTQLA